jgi:hypothetical protein
MSGGGGAEVPGWERLADVLLQREAALCRLGSGVPPRDVPGLYVADEDLETLLRALPGLDWPDDAGVAAVRARFDAPVAEAWRGLETWASTDAGQDGLAGIVSAAGGELIDLATLGVLVAAELSPQRQRLLGYCQDDVQLCLPTAPTLTRLLGEGGLPASTLGPSGPLRRAELVSALPAGSEPMPWARRMLGVAPRVLWSVLGDGSLDPDLPAGTGLRRVRLGAGNRRAQPGVLLVHGADSESRCVAAARLLGASALLTGPVAGTPEQWRALVREATVSGAAVVLEVPASGLEAPAAAAMARATHVRWVLSSAGELTLESLHGLLFEEFGVRDGAATQADWQGRMGMEPPDGAMLSREQLRLVAAASGGDPGRVPAAVRRLAGGHLEGLSVRVRPRRNWGDLVLPPHESTQLRELVSRYRRKAKVFGEWGFPAVPSSGTVALFAGPSGTGKTLAAEVVAAELGLDLYKVDLAAVVSKYIGETEKNLERIFTAAAAGDLVLFFDEADALFGKRSQVADAHDRYANIEVAYLLQRLETYDGLVVLATNLQRNIDEAFLRRIGVAITFPDPDEEQRRAIWQLAIPDGAPSAGLDFDFLARQFKITGGVIRSAALGAAFLAADGGDPITMDHVVLALRREFSKLGHLSTESEFGGYADLVKTPVPTSIGSPVR